MPHYNVPVLLKPNWLRLVKASLLFLAAIWVSSCGLKNNAPDSRFVLLDGSILSNADLKGKVTLINFWATTCVSCVKKMPALAATHHKYQAQGFETVAVAMSYDPPHWVLNFAQSRQLPFKVALDQEDTLAKSWGDVKLTPTTFLLNRKGQIVKRYVGDPEINALHRLVEKLLAEAA